MFRTYAEMIPDFFRNIEDSFCNKPRGGLWGCRGTEWKDWCTSEEFPCPDKYFIWKLREGANTYIVDNVNDFIYLLLYYPRILDDSFTVDSIDYMKMWNDGYDAIELTQQGLQDLRLGIDILAKNVMTKYMLGQPAYNASVYLGMNAWDVPSICVFEPNKNVIITSDVKYEYPYYQNTKELEAASSRGNRSVSY